MNNIDLELRIKDILDTKNFFDMIEKAVSFEKEYKQTNFYKNTHMSIMEVIKTAKVWYTIDFDNLLMVLQEKINKLDLSHITKLFEQMGELFGQENEEILNMIKEVKDITL